MSLPLHRAIAHIPQVAERTEPVLSTLYDDIPISKERNLMKKTRSMRHPQARTCSFWAKRLAALRPKDLLDPKNAELAAHLETCVFCKNLYEEYQQVARMIRALPDLHMRAGLPPQLLKEWGEPEGTEQPRKEKRAGKEKTAEDRRWPLHTDRHEAGGYSSMPDSIEQVRIASSRDADEEQARGSPIAWFC